MELNRRGFGVHMIIHPVMNVRRDADGRLLECCRPAPTRGRRRVRESVIHAEVDRQTDPSELASSRATSSA